MTDREAVDRTATGDRGDARPEREESEIGRAAARVEREHGAVERKSGVHDGETPGRSREGSSVEQELDQA